jgi:hypothetical protein
MLTALLEEAAAEGVETIPLRSSWLSHAVYNKNTLELTVFMQSGEHYDYFGITPETAAGLATAASPGRYYNMCIKL